MGVLAHDLSFVSTHNVLQVPCELSHMCLSCHGIFHACIRQDIQFYLVLYTQLTSSYVNSKSVVVHSKSVVVHRLRSLLTILLSTKRVWCVLILVILCRSAVKMRYCCRN